MEVLFHLINISLSVLSSNGVDLQLLESKLCYFLAISLLFRTDGRPGGWTGGRADGRLEKSILRLTQPSLAETWAELGNINLNLTLSTVKLTVGNILNNLKQILKHCV
jgi:hypothetical protein